MDAARSTLGRRVGLSLGALLACLGLFLLSAADASSDSSPWQQLTTVPSSSDPGVMLLLTDGSVLVQDQGASGAGGSTWWILRPDAHGSYVDGTWTQTGSLPAGYTPEYAASAVLPDGRVIVEGGEFNGTPTYAGSNQGAIYDPTTNAWTAVAPPEGGANQFNSISDAPSVTLANGTFMMGPDGVAPGAPACSQKGQVLFDASTLSWTLTGTGMSGANPESGFTLLPNGDVLTVDITYPSTSNTEIYDPSTGAWTSAGTTPSPLVNPASTDGSCYSEMGPAIQLPGGGVFAEGASSHTAIYNTSSGTWQAGPDFPVLDGQQYDADDAPAAVLPDGDVLMALSVDVDQPPTHFFVFDGTSISQIADPPSYPTQSCSSSCFYFLSLPTGQILVNGRLGPSTMYVYTPGGTPDPSWLPVITSVPKELSAGASYSVSGLQLNGLTQGSAFGDDWNMASNYPLVQVTSRLTGAVAYARTTGMTSMSVAPNVASSAHFAVPASITNGPALLRVVASGFASSPVAVQVTGGINPPVPGAVRVAFKGRSGKLSSAARANLQKLSQRLIGGAAVTVTGYAKADATLARKRARAVLAFLSSKVTVEGKIRTVTKTKSNVVSVVTTAQ